MTFIAFPIYSVYTPFIFWWQQRYKEIKKKIIHISLRRAATTTKHELKNNSLGAKLDTHTSAAKRKKGMQPVVPFQYFTAEKNPACQLSSLVRNNASSLDPSYHSASLLNSPRRKHTTRKKSRHNDRSQTTLPSCVAIRLVNWAAAFPPPAAPGRQVPWSSPTEIAALIVLLLQGVRGCPELCGPC